MYICTYKLPGREKTFTAPTIPAAHKLFLKDYKEAAGEVKKVKIEKQNDVMFLMVLSYPTYRDFFANPKAEPTDLLYDEITNNKGGV
tara:strand:+ start:224 stop:484 length:261 start_codon:yes stop_codon:yes gene_type:complete